MSEALKLAAEAIEIAKELNQKLNGEDKDPPATEPQTNQLTEIVVPDDKAKSLTVSSQIVQKAEADFEIAQARLIASRNAHDALYFKICAQCGANPDEFDMKAEGKTLKFVKAQK